jgi:hypothetical protein
MSILRIDSFKIEVPYWIKEYYNYCKESKRYKDDLLTLFGNINERTLVKYSSNLRRILKPTTETLIIRPEDGITRNGPHIYYITNKSIDQLKWKIDNQIHNQTRLATNAAVTSSFWNGLDVNDPARVIYEVGIKLERMGKENIDQAMEMMAKR